jgi:hypothetical protein
LGFVHFTLVALLNFHFPPDATAVSSSGRSPSSTPWGTKPAATLTVASKPTITTQPASATAAAGDKVSFSVKASGATSYKWQTYIASSGKWADITSSDYSGVKTATMSVTATAARNGMKVRCVVTNASGSVNSEAAALTLS